MKNLYLFLFTAITILFCNLSYGQDTSGLKTRTLKRAMKDSLTSISERVKSSGTDSINTNLIKLETALKDTVLSEGRLGKEKVKGAFKQLSDTSVVNKKGLDYLRNKMAGPEFEKAKEIKSSSLKKDSIAFNMAIENGLLYMQKSPLKSGPTYLNVFSVSTQVTIGKIPIVIDVSKNYRSTLGFDPFGSNLFKVNFDRQTYVNSMKSDLDKIGDFQKNILKGSTLPAFIRKSISSKLKSVDGGRTLSKDSAFASFVKDNDNLGSLLKMDRKQMKDKLWSVVEKAEKRRADTLKRRLEASEERVADLKTRTEQQKAKMLHFKKKADEHQEKITSAAQQYNKQKEDLSGLGNKLESNKERLLNPLDSLRISKENLAALHRDSISAVNERLRIVKTLDSVTNRASELHDRMDQSIDSVVTAVSTVKQQIESYGVTEERIADYRNYLLTGEMASLEPTVMTALQGKPEYNKVQTIFTKVREFQSGAFANTIPGSFFNQNVFIKGVNFSFNTRRGPLTLGLGSQNDVGQPKDAEFNSSVFSSPRLITYISIPTYKTALGSGKVSWTGSFNQSSAYIASIPRTNMALTVTQNLNLQKFGTFTIDVSKSTSQYLNSVTPGSEQLLFEKATSSTYSGNNLFETLSFGFNYQSDIKSLGISNTIYFNYAGLGYQSPGAAGMMNMRKRIGGNLRKQLYNNKISFNLRTDFKTTPASFSGNSEWTNYQVQLDGRYMISRKYTVGLKYTGSGMDRKGDNAASGYTSGKYQFEGKANYKIGKNHSFSYLNIGRQNMDNKGLSLLGTASTVPGLSTAADFITINYAQNLIVKNLNFSANVFYNRELSSYKLIGNMLNTDAGCQYVLFKSLNLSSSLTFLDNEGVARQAGIKQNITVAAGKHFDISAYMDIRKNLTEPLYPDLYTTKRGEFSIKYYLKNRL